ncbi:hypothetical protein C4J81_16370 [Deltaproteobacteria bacterium Smac51]|nr:hypothetical protein C4J81_16370 [Deltaproteobacteria bacterium Smac51]
MLTLKDVLNEEAGVFFNPDEFGEEITIDGQPALGVWDEEVQPVAKFYGATMNMVGVNTVERNIYVLPLPEADIPLPVADQEIEIDGVKWMVRDARPDGRIFKMTIFRNES